MQKEQSARLGWRHRIIRIYLSGFVCLGLIYFGWRLLDQFLPWFKDLENPWLSGFLAVLAVILLPPLLGSVVQFGLNPILSKWAMWSELASLEERLVTELARDDRQPVVVLVNWPSETERTVGVMTTVFPATDDSPELCAVYIALAPRSKSGYIRIIATSQVKRTGWTFKEFQMYQWTVGAVAPPALLEVEE